MKQQSVLINRFRLRLSTLVIDLLRGAAANRVPCDPLKPLAFLYFIEFGIQHQRLLGLTFLKPKQLDPYELEQVLKPLYHFSFDHVILRQFGDGAPASLLTADLLYRLHLPLQPLHGLQLDNYLIIEVIQSAFNQQLLLLGSDHAQQNHLLQLLLLIDVVILAGFRICLVGALVGIWMVFRLFLTFLSLGFGAFEAMIRVRDAFFVRAIGPLRLLLAASCAGKRCSTRTPPGRRLQLLPLAPRRHLLLLLIPLPTDPFFILMIINLPDLRAHLFIKALHLLRLLLTKIGLHLGE